MRLRLVAQHDVVAAPALTLLLHQLLPRKQVLVLEELITFRSGDCRKWNCPYLLHDQVVDAIDATINNAEFCYIGEMQKPNSEFIEHDKNDNQEFTLEHNVEPHVHSMLGKQDQEFKAGDLAPRMSARLEHDVESPEHNSHGTQDQEFKVDDFTSRKSKTLVHDNAIAAVEEHDEHENAKHLRTICLKETSHFLKLVFIRLDYSFLINYKLSMSLVTSIMI